MNEQRCPECGYTKEDAQFHMDHKLCRNSGNAPWEKRADRNRAEPSPEPEAAPRGRDAEHDDCVMAMAMGLQAQPEPQPAAQPPASEAQAPAVPHMTNEMLEVIIDNMANRYICSQGEARSMARELAQLRARVAILDAQEVELPPMDYGLAAQEQCDVRERQLLDALRAVQAWRTIMRELRDGLVAARDFIDSGGSGWFPQKWRDAIAAYDALAGKGE